MKSPKIIMPTQLNVQAHLKHIKETIRYPACVVALGFGVGLLRVMPGTLATVLVGIPLYYVLSTLHVFYYGLIVLALIGLGVLVCGIAEEVLGNADDPIIVWDEVCGYLLTMLGTPRGSYWVLLGFLLFRYFDIFKLWPIDVINREVKGGVGIVLDDLLAAAYAQLTMRCLMYLLL